MKEKCGEIKVNNHSSKVYYKGEYPALGRVFNGLTGIETEVLVFKIKPHIIKVS